MIKTKAVKLVKALRSGEYSQGKGNLVSHNDEFCCLGVACNISTSPLEWCEEGGRWNIGEVSMELPEQIIREFGFYTPDGGRRDDRKLEINGRYFHGLAEANDAGCTFAEIADYIEENYEML